MLNYSLSLDLPWLWLQFILQYSILNGIWKYHAATVVNMSLYSLFFFLKKKALDSFKIICNTDDTHFVTKYPKIVFLLQKATENLVNINGDSKTIICTGQEKHLIIFKDKM